MEIQCPSCASHNIKKQNYAQKTLGALGTFAGAGTGIRSVLYGGKIGARIGMMAGLPGGATGMIIGSIFGALVSGSLGCEIGSTVGKKIDQSILNNFVCCDCDCSFSKDHDSSDEANIQLYHPS